MGFLWFGKKKKAEPVTPPVTQHKNTILRRPSQPVGNGSATSSLSAASSGSSSGSPPEPRRANTYSGAAPVDRAKRSLSFAPDIPSSSAASSALKGKAAATASPRIFASNNSNNSSNNDLPPVPPIPASLSSSRNGSSSSLNPINSTPYANRALSKKGSTNTINSMFSANGTRRSPHSAPARDPSLAAFAKPRATSYHAPQVRNIWTSGAYYGGENDVGFGTNAPPLPLHGKYNSTGSPFQTQGASYMNAHNNPNHHVSDVDFKAYTKAYDTAIAKAHTLAREYHHLPPARRDRDRFEQIGQAFAAAAALSREHWSYRCRLEHDRLEHLVKSGAPISPADLALYASPHAVAGMRATEGWQYASMLADAWGCPGEMSIPLEEMPVLKPDIPADNYYDGSQISNSWSGGGGYVHPGYMQNGYASYMAEAATASKYKPRNRLDSTASMGPAASVDSHASSHTHSGISHHLQNSRSNLALAGGNASGTGRRRPSVVSLVPELERRTSSIHEEPVETRPPVVLRKAKRYRERSNSNNTPATAIAVA